MNGEQRLNILFIAPANSIHSARFIQYFANDNNSITWVSFADPIRETEGLLRKVTFRVVRIKKDVLLPLHLVSGILQILRISRTLPRPLIVHAHSAGIYGLVGALLNIRPLVISAWGSDVLLNRKNIIKKIILLFMLRRANLITTDGHNVEAAIKELGIPPTKIRFVQFGVDTHDFSPPKEMPADNVVISIRNLEPIYDVGTLINAIPEVVARFPEILFLIAGEGSQKKSLISDVVKLGIEKNVKFIGKIPHDKLPEILGGATMYVSTSLSDGGLALSTAEAMACGLPVIVTDTSDNKSWVRDGEGGFVIAPKKYNTLAEKIIYLLSNPKARMEMGILNRSIVVKKNDYYGEMEKMNKIYYSVLFSTNV